MRTVASPTGCASRPRWTVVSTSTVCRRTKLYDTSGHWKRSALHGHSTAGRPRGRRDTRASAQCSRKSCRMTAGGRATRRSVSAPKRRSNATAPRADSGACAPRCPISQTRPKRASSKRAAIGSGTGAPRCRRMIGSAPAAEAERSEPGGRQGVEGPRLEAPSALADDERPEAQAAGGVDEGLGRHGEVLGAAEGADVERVRPARAARRDGDAPRVADGLARTPARKGHEALEGHVVHVAKAARPLEVEEEPPFGAEPLLRSEERRVGKEGRSRWSPY